MTYEEAKTRLTDLIGNPDTAPEQAVGFLEDLRTDYETLNSLATKSEEDENRIRDLQDTNQKLFLSVTGNPAEDEKEEDDAPGVNWDDILKED